ncbi:Ig-like domain-containing protein [Mucilaginibacter myungsuensis]|uniref:Ig-like domain-containing protein n=1 Tax=Mucilaginibacter myungsuensis TaxID=649104 RepID=A0A929KZ93_9SPHI|nr:hypothetical protein [Mucilaginibacter myungsuensis]MBE9662678.1 hypothetical protein [Mucilaginibacter myungsuensis]MDN3598098.1 hypothetical protein [Mucilaginibacter myungsuensis]
MVRIFKLTLLKNAGLHLWCGPAFLLLCLIASCNPPERHELALLWEKDKAVAILIPPSLVDVKQASVHLAGSRSAILGDFIEKDSSITFRPLIPLSPGMTYEIWYKQQPIAKISVPATGGNKPKLLTIYPELDTLPENLLKFYLHFDHPMRTGEVLQHVHLLDNKGDTLQSIFLNLQPELWDTTGTTLTLWLDPGRIKRGLVLNKELGNPLKTAQQYQLVVSADWKDSRGLLLEKAYSKKFVAGVHDGAKPDMDQWKLRLPKVGSTEPLVMDLNEPLDHYLLTGVLSMQDAKGNSIKGTISTANKDQQWIFTPLKNWQPGRYQLKAQAKLEDLAGNNLDKVFDRDVREDKQEHQEVFVRWFEIRNL